VILDWRSAELTEEEPESEKQASRSGRETICPSSGTGSEGGRKERPRHG